MKVLLVIWTNPAWHPSFVFTSQLLSERGYFVTILCRRHDATSSMTSGVTFGPNISLYEVVDRLGPSLPKVAYLDFVRIVWQTARSLRPEVVIGFDLYGFVAAYLGWRGRKGGKLFYHNFDVQPFESTQGLVRMLKRIEHLGARSANLVLVSSPARGAMLMREAKLLAEPLTVMNCQRLGTGHSTACTLRQILREKGLEFDRLVVRLGSLGPGHGIEATIHSVARWTGNWGLILAGTATEDYLQQITTLISSLNIADRILLLPSVPFDLWFDCLYAADVGIALYERNQNVNHESMAGAGNKLSLYLKAGIPSIVPNFPDFVRLLDQYDVGMFVDPTNSDDIAGAINRLLSDPRLYARLKENAQRAFRAKFNFEAQFAPVMTMIEASQASSATSDLRR